MTVTDIDVNASSLLASAGWPRPAGDVEDLIARMPITAFHPVSREWIMWAQEARDELRRQRDEIARLKHRMELVTAQRRRV